MIYSYLNNATTADGIHSIAWTTQWTFHEVVVLGIVSLIPGTSMYMYRRLLVTGGKSNTKSIGYNSSSWGKTNTAMTVISKKSTVWKSLFTSHGAFQTENGIFQCHSAVYHLISQARLVSLQLVTPLYLCLDHISSSYVIVVDTMLLLSFFCTYFVCDVLRACMFLRIRQLT